VTPAGLLVRLEPYEDRHYPALQAAADDPRIWEWMPTRWAGERFAGLVDVITTGYAEGKRLSFAICRVADGSVVGLTEYLDIRLADCSVEIGTWLAPSEWSGPTNPETKFLLLEHAFKRLACGRVQFRTDRLNQRSSAAIRKLGAVAEGVLRREKRVQDGRIRDTCLFSILAEEWPAVSERLRRRLDRFEASPLPLVVVTGSPEAADAVR
jgi:N-acetyltransferase